MIVHYFRLIEHVQITSGNRDSRIQQFFCTACLHLHYNYFHNIQHEAINYDKDKQIGTQNMQGNYHMNRAQFSILNQVNNTKLDDI